jgi:hypothetical protein
MLFIGVVRAEEDVVSTVAFNLLGGRLTAAIPLLLFVGP